jgi:valyl-tRNA synthetase
MAINGSGDPRCGRERFVATTLSKIMVASIPDKPTLEGLEAKWRARWEEQGTYRFDRSKDRADIYSIDTPPPTVSGALHIGHCCSFTHTDLVARYWRMRGKEVFYPMGWDDNGLNVERRVQLMLGITCDPSLPYDPSFVPPETPPKRPIPISRPNFIECCARVTEMLEQQYFDLWSTLGLSVDWTQTYTTIGDHVRRTSQFAFLRLVDRDLAYRAEAPTLWDVDMRTAVAQAELEDRTIGGAYHRLRFRRAEGGPGAGEPIAIETTRPELLAACVALVAHPDDERYQPLFGTEAQTPLFDVRVPIVAHELAEPDKGSGIAMICTFGDTTDVIWWRELGLPVRAIVDKDGTISAAPPEGIDSERGRSAYAEMAGISVKQAQRRVVELLRESGELEGEPSAIEHPVKFWENGSRPLEIVTNRQWFIRYPPKEDMLARGRELRWWPEFMRVRYEDWVNGLIGDWNITRQRFFGVPFPVWYPIDGDGAVRHTEPILAEVSTLPVDPSTDVPPGYTADRRDQPGGFTGDPDVMDTWASSSLTPQIASHWVDDPDLFARIFPMDLRPQAHEIIRTWLFCTVVRSHYEHGLLPWTNAAISGFVFDPDRKKLSKSSGNAPEEPNAILAEYGADAVRYWASGGRPGMDLAFDRNQLKVGRRLAIKLLNASRFALGLGEPPERAQPTRPLDRSMLAALAAVVDGAIAAFESYDYTRALERIEAFFWTFCDDYLELVKGRAYGAAGDEARASAQVALRTALDVLLRLFAPFLPFVTEEVWSWWRTSSIHRAAWPDGDALRALAGDADPLVREVAATVLGEVRKAKTTAKQSLRAEVRGVRVGGSHEQLEALWHAVDDLREAGNITEVDTHHADNLVVEVTLA